MTARGPWWHGRPARVPVALRAKAEAKIGLLVPKDNASEAAVVKGLQVIPIHNLREAVRFLAWIRSLCANWPTAPRAKLYNGRDTFSRRVR